MTNYYAEPGYGDGLHWLFDIRTSGMCDECRVDILIGRDGWESKFEFEIVHNEMLT